MVSLNLLDLSFSACCCVAASTKLGKDAISCYKRAGVASFLGFSKHPRLCHSTASWWISFLGSYRDENRIRRSPIPLDWVVPRIVAEISICKALIRPQLRSTHHHERCLQQSASYEGDWHDYQDWSTMEIFRSNHKRTIALSRARA